MAAQEVNLDPASVDCTRCSASLHDASREFVAEAGAYYVEWLTCGKCSYQNVVKSFVHPAWRDPAEGLLIYNELTELFDEYANDGTLIRANVIRSPRLEVSNSEASSWPDEKNKPKRAGSQTWLDGDALDRKRSE